MNIAKKISKILSVVTAEAHCDVPCGIYDPTAAKIAAKTVQRMVMQITELKPPEHDHDQVSGAIEFSNAIARRIINKEKHAQICKDELSILWSDYFKPEHLEKYPDLHMKFWNALKLASKNKQSVDPDLAKQLVLAVDEIAKIFYETKGDAERFTSYQAITDKLF